MSAGIQALRAEPAAPGRPLGRLKGRRRVFDYIATGAMGTALLIAVVPTRAQPW